MENMCRETSEEVSRVAGKCEEMMKKEREEIVGEVHRGIGEMERRLGVAVRGGEEAVERVEERLGKVEKEVKSSRRRNSGSRVCECGIQREQRGVVGLVSMRISSRGISFRLFWFITIPRSGSGGSECHRECRVVDFDFIRCKMECWNVCMVSSAEFRSFIVSYRSLYTNWSENIQKPRRISQNFHIGTDTCSWRCAYFPSPPCETDTVSGAHARRELFPGLLAAPIAVAVWLMDRQTGKISLFDR